MIFNLLKVRNLHERVIHASQSRQTAFVRNLIQMQCWIYAYKYPVKLALIIYILCAVDELIIGMVDIWKLFLSNITCACYAFSLL